MTARCTAAVLLATLGSAAALAVTGASAGDPAPVTTTVQTVTVVTQTPATYQSKPLSWWVHRAVVNRREANQQRKDSLARGRTIGRLRRVQARKYAPTVDYAIRLASVVYGVPEGKMRAVAWCESRLRVDAVNGQYRSLFQEGSMFERGPFGRAGFSVWDPIANALTAGYTVAHDGSWRQWTCGGA